MKKTLTLSIAIVFSVLLLPATVSAQVGMKPIADSGMFTLGQDQVLRVTVATGDGDDNIRIRFRQIEYMQQGNIYSVSSANTSPPVTLNSGEAASIDLPNNGAGVRAVVMGNSRTVKVTMVVFDTSTQRVVAICTFIPD